MKGLATAVCALALVVGGRESARADDGDELLRRGSYRAALVRAGEIAAEAPLADKRAQSGALALRAEALMELGELDEADLALEAALDELRGTPHADRLVRIEVITGELRYRQGRLGEARAAFGEARRWCEALGTVGADAELSLAEGRLMAAEGASDMALMRFETARSACGDERCRARVDVAIGAVAFAQGDLVVARRTLVPAVAALSEAAWWHEAGHGLVSLVRVHLAWGEIETASVRAEEATDVAARAESAALQAEAAEVRGEVALAGGHRDAARTWLERARAAWGRARSAPGVLANRLLLARTALADGSLGEARVHLEAARERAASLDDADAGIAAASLLSDVAAREGHTDEARARAEEALARGPAPRLAAQLLARLGRLDAAVEASERVALARFPDGAREVAFRERQSIYDARVEQVVALADAGEADAAAASELALETSERSIGRAFMDMLERSRVVRSSPETAEAFRALADVDKEARAAAGRGDLAGLARLSRRQAALEAAALGLAPASTDRSVERIERALAELRARIRPDVAVLKFHLGEPRSHLWVITDQGTTRLDLPARSALVSRVLRFVDAVATPSARRSDGPALFETMLAPALEAIGARRRLVLVPHRELRLVPFDALPLPASWGTNRFVLDAFTTSEAPSIAALMSLEAQLAERQSRRRYPLAAFADPLYAGKAASLPRLVMTAAEAHQASLHLQGAEADAGAVFLREDASEARLKALALTRYRMLHLATHGFAPDAVTPDAQPSLFFGAGGSPPEDGILTIDEALGLRLDADLVVLSACSSARGALEPGDGLGGLVHAFLYAGSAGVLATLWPIEDKHAAALMNAFYREVAQGRSSAASLRAARLELLRPGHTGGAAGLVLRGMGGIVGDPAPALPKLPRRAAGTSDRDAFFWAPYVLVGATGDILR